MPPFRGTLGPGKDQPPRHRRRHHPAPEESFVELPTTPTIDASLTDETLDDVEEAVFTEIDPEAPVPESDALLPLSEYLFPSSGEPPSILPPEDILAPSSGAPPSTLPPEDTFVPSSGGPHSRKRVFIGLLVLPLVAAVVLALVVGGGVSPHMTAPKISSHPPLTSTSTSATFGFSSDNNNATFQCSLD